MYGYSQWQIIVVTPKYCSNITVDVKAQKLEPVSATAPVGLQTDTIPGTQSFGVDFLRVSSHFPALSRQTLRGSPDSSVMHY
jgi:hypothetical protein